MSDWAAPGSRFEITHDLAPFTEGLIEACAHGDLTYTGLEYGVSTGRYIAFTITGQAMAVFELERPVLTCVALAGKGLVDWLPELAVLAEWLARDQDCKEVRCYGRPGWARALKGLGYKAQSVLVRKEV